MGKTRFLLLLALPMLALAGCGKDGIEPQTPDMGDTGGITFNIGFAGQDGQTRVATDAEFRSAWEEGDQIGIFAAAHGQPLASGGNYIHNVRLTYSAAGGGAWSFDPGVGLWWPTGAEGITALDFYAYSPYSAEATDPTAIAFNVLTDQSGATDGKSNYNASDLLTARSDNSGAGWARGETVALTFSHALAMVQVTVPSTMKGAGPSEGLKAILRGVRPGAALDLGAGSVTVPETDGNEATNITMHRVERPGDANYGTSFTYRALVPAQTVAAGRGLFLFDHEGRQVFADEALGAPLAMAGGQAELFTRTLPSTIIHTAKISAGKFTMGSPANEPGRFSDETQHEVTLTEDFYMSRYAITNAQYAAFLNAEGIGYDGRADVAGYGNRTLVIWDEWGLGYADGAWKPQAGYENHPVVNVMWYGAKAYADWAGGALPTEAQWEYACRAGSTTVYSYGDAANGDYMWYGDNSGGSPNPVGQKTPNDWGLYDMHGNVYEWCTDWHGDYPAGPVTDPAGPASGFTRVLRGGSWDGGAQYCRSAERFISNPDSYRDYMGFRVVFHQ